MNALTLAPGSIWGVVLKFPVKGLIRATWGLGFSLVLNGLLQRRDHSEYIS